MNSFVTVFSSKIKYLCEAYESITNMAPVYLQKINDLGVSADELLEGLSEIVKVDITKKGYSLKMKIGDGGRVLFPLKELHRLSLIYKTMPVPA